MYTGYSNVRHDRRISPLIVTFLLSVLLTGLSPIARAYHINGFTFSGDVRTGRVQYDFHNPDGDPAVNKGHRDSQGFYVIPKFSLLTPVYHDFSGKITLAGATDFGLNNPEKETRNFVFDPVELKSFALLQELYLEWQTERHQVLIGRKEYVTPMIDADDWYMLANSFAMGVYDNRYFNNTSLRVGYFAEMAGVWDSSANGTEFHSMSDASIVPQANKDEADDSGVYFAAADFNNDVHHVQLWNYYADDLYNTLFAQYDFTRGNDNFNYDIGTQFIDFSEVGKLRSSPTEIDYSIYSLRYDAGWGNGFSLATGVAKYTDGGGANETLGAWGGYPYFANGMVFHFFEAGSLQNAESYKLQVGYDFARQSPDKLGIYLRHTRYNLDPKYSIASDGDGQDLLTMTGIQLKYRFLGGGYFTGTYEQHHIDDEPRTWALRLIGGFTF
ncbi:MAG: hypothetical protein ABFS24_02665 [Pseudomonadota bacterium]